MYSRLSDAYYDKGSEASDTFDGVCLEFDGTECLSKTKKIYAKKLICSPAEQRILDQWKTLMDAVRQTDEYDPRLTYGVYQIFAEIDTSYKDDEGNTVWNNVEVHSALQTLKALVKEYYNAEIVPTLFEYEFLK